jgi:hypothetical protein
VRLLDLFAGELGWSKVFAARGHHCICVDLKIPKQAPKGCDIVRCDVLELKIKDGWFWVTGQKYVRVEYFDAIVASSPCEEFSTLRNFRPPVIYPAMGVKLFNHTRELCEASGLPYVMENVAGAMRYVGKAVHHCGPFYLWGNAVPPLMPQGIRKGLTALVMGCRERKGQQGWNDRGTGKKGQNDTAKVATIPPELANCVCDYMERILLDKKKAAS